MCNYFHIKGEIIFRIRFNTQQKHPLKKPYQRIIRHDARHSSFKNYFRDVRVENA